LYVVRVYEKTVASRAIYKTAVVKIPKPEFIVLYNGMEDMPDVATLRLSDAFIALGSDEKPELELVVKVYNVNPGHNEKILQRSMHLAGYARFVERIRENCKRELSRENAIKEAITYCIKNNVLKLFLQEHGSEVENMLLTEWNWDDAKEVWQEEAREESRKKRDGELLSLIEKGYTMEQLRNILSLQEAEPVYREQ
jgi:hypothetical protein